MCGPVDNTLQPFLEHPPDRVITESDIVFLDLGPVFEEWEADFRRTFVLGDDPDKHAVRDALPRVWQASRDYFENHPDVTRAELFDVSVEAGRGGWLRLGCDIAGLIPLAAVPHRKDRRV